MHDLRVPTVCLPVEIHCVTGRSVLGEIFLPAYSSRQPGPMGPEEWADTAPHFFPVRAQESGVTMLINRDAVVALTVPASSNAIDSQSLMDCPVNRVAVEAGGARFEGDIVVDMPPDQQRVLDWLNSPTPFLTVRNALAHHLIQKRHVTSVVELDRGRA